MVIAIAAVAENNVLGKDNELLWHLPDDFKRFKLLTSGHHIIMGRKTFESFPKPLPNRTHIIITRQKEYKANNCIIVNSMKKAIDIVPKNEAVFIIGGGQIYDLGLKWTDKIELTRIHASFEGDTFFPLIDTNEWELNNVKFHPKDHHHDFEFTYQTFVRKKNFNL